MSIYRATIIVERIDANGDLETSWQDSDGFNADGYGQTAAIREIISSALTKFYCTHGITNQKENT